MNKYEHFELSVDELGLLNHLKGIPRTVLNIPIRIDFLSDIDEEKIIEAMRLTVTRLPFCTIRIHEYEDGSFSQYYCPEEPEGLDIVDMSTSSEEEINAYVLKMANTPFPNNCIDSQLYNFKLIRTPGGRHTIFFCGFHVIMDSVGVIQVISYFDKVYSALTNGTELPERGIGIEKHIEEGLEYRSSPKLKRDIDWWCEQFETAPHFSSFNPRGSDVYIEGSNYGNAQTLLQLREGVFRRRIPLETVNKVNEAALSLNVAPQLYYFLALRTFLAHMSGNEDVSISTTGARRSTLMQKKCGMTLAHMVTFRSDIRSEETSFKDALLQLSIIQKNMYRHINCFMADYEPIIRKKHNIPEKAVYKAGVFTYQPYVSVENTNLDCTARHVNIGMCPYPFYINVMPMDVSGELWVEYMYPSDYTKTENIEKFHPFMMKFIEEGISNPEKTVAAIRDSIL